MAAPKGLKLARIAALAYTATCIAGSAISIRRDYPPKAIGIDPGVDARRGVVNGIHGAGLAAPWNLVVQMWLAAAIAQRSDTAGRRARAWLAFLSAMFLAGAVGEPVTHKVVTRELPPADTTVAIANMVVPTVMLAASLRSLVDTE